MVTRLTDLSANDDGERSIKYSGNDELDDKTLDYFTGPTSRFFFEVGLLNLDTDFLSHDVETWLQQSSFQEALKIAQALKVVSDSADRAIALATNFNLSLTKRDDEKQCLYQVVEAHRKQFPNANKSTFLEQLE
jgi:hypothetical protein